MRRSSAKDTNCAAPPGKRQTPCLFGFCCGPFCYCRQTVAQIWARPPALLIGTLAGLPPCMPLPSHSQPVTVPPSESACGQPPENELSLNRHPPPATYPPCS